MDDFELFQRFGLALSIGASVGVERHWRERDEAEGARTAGIRTFTMIGMLGGAAGLIEQALGPLSSYSGIALTGFLLALAGVMAVFELREAIAQNRYSVTSVIAAMLTYALGALAVLGDMALASAGGVALVALLASREPLHAAIRRLQWVELRSAIILLTMSFVLLPIIPRQPIGPFGGVSPASIMILAIMLAAISFAGYVAVRLLGPSHGDLVAGAIGGVVSSTATTIAFARRSKEGASSRLLAAGAIAAGGVSLARTAIVVGTLGATLLPALLPPLLAGAAVMALYAVLLAYRGGPTGEPEVPANPFELLSVAKMAVLLVAVAFLARAATQYFGDAGLLTASALSALADVDAATVTVTSMLSSLSAPTAAQAIGVAVLANLGAKAVYASVIATRGFSLHLWLASLAAVLAALATHGIAAVS
ncbi:MAG: MgtC/SapB family protein [Allorhizobium sp.]